MTFRRFIKLIREYPYLLNDTYVRSAEETREIFRAYAPTLSEAVARAKARADLPDEAWVYMETLAERIDRKNERKQRIKAGVERFGARLRSHRRLAAVCVIVLVVLAYFTLIPSGRTLAKNFFEHIMSIAGNRIEFRLPTKSDDTIIVDPDFEEKEIHETTSCEYSSVREYIKATGMIPYTLNYRKLKLQTIYEEVSPLNGRFLWIDYRLGEDGIVSLRQEWIYGEEVSLYSNTDSYKVITLKNHDLMYYHIDEADGSFQGMMPLEDGSILYLYVNKSPYIEEMLSILQ